MPCSIIEHICSNLKQLGTNVFSRKFAVFCIFLHTLLNSVNGRILRRTCGDYANFSYVELDKVLQGEKITIVVVSSDEECELACIDELQCKSINIEKTMKARQCELNKRSTADASDGVVLTRKPGWVFKSTSFTENMVFLSETNITKILRRIWKRLKYIYFVFLSTCKMESNMIGLQILLKSYFKKYHNYKMYI